MAAIAEAVAGAIGGVANSIIGGLNYKAQKEYNDKMLALNREQFDYQKALQKEIFAREDSATQRKMQDLIKSGLNPMLAGGQTANAGEAVGTTSLTQGMNGAPQLQFDPQTAIDNVYNLMKRKEDIATTKAQRDLLYSQIAKNAVEATNIAADTNVKKQSYQESVYNYRKYKGLGLPTNFIANNPYSSAQGGMFMAKDLLNDTIEQTSKHMHQNNRENLDFSKRKGETEVERAKRIGGAIYGY